MKIYKTQAEVEKDIKYGVLNIKDNVTFECSISIDVSIIAYNINAFDIKADNINANNINANNINAYNIDAYNINANNIDANNIDANNINAFDIKADNIDAYNINANNIDANNIDAFDIKADNIDARDISYYAFCVSYNGIKCSSITPRRTNHQEPICLDGELIITPKEQTSNPKEITIDGAVYVLKEGSKR